MILSIRFYFMLIVALLFCYSKSVLAADIYVGSAFGGYMSSYVIEGIIQKGDYNKFRLLISENDPSVKDVYLYSKGGDLLESMRIGKLIRQLRLHTVAPKYYFQGKTLPMCLPIKPKDEENCACFSSCFFVFVGGIHRFGDYLGVHRPYINKDELQQTSIPDIEEAYMKSKSPIKSYLEDMDVPSAIYDKMMANNSEELEILSYQSIKKHFSGYVPFYEEAMLSRCQIRSPDEKAMWKKLNSKKGGTEAEKFLFKSLTNKMKEEVDCRYDVELIIRRDAYKVFITNYNMK